MATNPTPLESLQRMQQAIGMQSCPSKEPFIKLGKGQPPVLDYNLPQTTSFSTFGSIRKYVKPEVFKDFTKEVPPNNFFDAVANMPTQQVKTLFEWRGRTIGFSGNLGNDDLPTRDKMPGGNITASKQQVEAFVKMPQSVVPVYNETALKWLGAETTRAKSPRELNIQATKESETPAINQAQAEYASQKLMPITFTSFTNRNADVKPVARPPRPEPYFVIIEEFKTSSYLGNYGAGRAIKTFSLLPGEQTTISIRTYKDMETTQAYSQNIIDSLSSTSAGEISRLIAEESGNMSAYQDTSSGGGSSSFSTYSESYKSNNSSKGWNISGSLGGAIGGMFGMGIGGGYGRSRSSSSGSSSGSSSSWSSDYNYAHTGIRSANISILNNAMDRHVNETNASRLIDVNTSTTSSTRSGEETATVRMLENYNKSRVLNFVFRQLLQEYVTVTYLSNIKVAYCNGYPESMEIVELSALENLLKDVIKPGRTDNQDNIDYVRKELLKSYCKVENYKDEAIDFIEQKIVSYGSCILGPGNDEREVFWRVRRNIEDTVTVGENTIKVPGVILSVKNQILRTSSVVVDALLGQGEALDCFNKKAQDSEILSQYIDNMRDIQQMNVVQDIEIATDRPEAYHKVFAKCCPPVTQVLPVAVANPPK